MTQYLHGVEIVEVDQGPRPVRTVRSAVIGLVGTALEGPVDTPTLVAGRSEGAAAFGASGGTIPDALEAIFDQTGALVVVVNCLDPAVRHRDVARRVALADGALTIPDARVRAASLVVRNTAGAITYRPSLPGRRGDYAYDAATRVLTRVDRPRADVAEAEYVGADGVWTLPDQRVSNVVVKSQDGGTTYQTPRDYAVDEDAGTIARVDVATAPAADATVKVAYRRLVGIPAANTELALSYDVPDAAAVTAGDVAGEVGADGSYSGSMALLGAESALGHRPRILCAPGHSDDLAVGNALIARAERLRAVAVIEGPSTTDAAAVAYAGQLTASRRAYLVDPQVRISDGADGAVDAPASARVAGVIARSDVEHGFWWSPSNRPIAGVLGTARPVDWALGDPNARANLLNEDNVATIVREGGYRLWGNRTLSADAKYAFLSVSRTADLIMDSLQRAHLWAVDRNVTRTYLSDVAESVNSYIASLVGEGALAGGSCVPSDANTPQTVAAGRVCWDVDFTPYSPAEHVQFRVALVNDYLEEVLQ